MHPYKRKRRVRSDMITLGGWLFADLLLGLSMLFLVANTVGSKPPEPTPTPMPDYLATSQAEIESNQLSADQTVEALNGQLAVVENSANATATANAMSDNDRATADAKATNDAFLVQATVQALSTEQAQGKVNEGQLNTDLATSRAEATRIAGQVNAQSTENASLSAQSTKDASQSGNARASLSQSESDLATSEARGQQVDNQLATSEAQNQANQSQLATAQANQANAQATTDAAQNDVLQAQQQAQLNTLDPNAVPKTIQVDLDGVISGDQKATENARKQLDGVFKPYVESGSCKIGFVLISSRAPDIPQGIQLSDKMSDMIQSGYPGLLQEPADGQSPKLASESIALPGTSPSGEVQLLLFMSAGCQPAGSVDAPVAIVRFDE